MILSKIIAYLKSLCDNSFTGQIRINVHEGDISEKIEVKQSHHLNNEKGEK